MGHWGPNLQGSTCLLYSIHECSNRPRSEVLACGSSNIACLTAACAIQASAKGFVTREQDEQTDNRQSQPCRPLLRGPEVPQHSILLREGMLVVYWFHYTGWPYHGYLTPLANVWYDPLNGLPEHLAPLSFELIVHFTTLL